VPAGCDPRGSSVTLKSVPMRQMNTQASTRPTSTATVRSKTTVVKVPKRMVR
jgi:hypothetical protein